MGLQIFSMTLGIAATNAYLLADMDTKNAVLIDPVDDADALIQMAKDAGVTIRMILATHAHFDHILASKALKEKTGAPFIIHKNAGMWLDALPAQGMRFGLGEFPEAATPDRWLDDAPEIITLDSIKLETLFTPGHSPDHIAYYLRDGGVLFCGDAIFERSIGRVDLPGGNYEQLMQSITQIILPLGNTVRLLPGHGDQTTIAQERRANPFVREYLAR